MEDGSLVCVPSLLGRARAASLHGLAPAEERPIRSELMSLTCVPAQTLAALFVCVCVCVRLLLQHILLRLDGLRDARTCTLILVYPLSSPAKGLESITTCCLHPMCVRLRETPLRLGIDKEPSWVASCFWQAPS